MSGHDPTFWAWSKAFFSSSSGKFSPKLMMESCSTPLQPGSSHSREVRWSKTPNASLVEGEGRGGELASY